MAVFRTYKSMHLAVLAGALIFGIVLFFSFSGQGQKKKSEAGAAQKATPIATLPQMQRPRIDFQTALDHTLLIEGDGVYGTGFVIEPNGPQGGLAITAHHVVAEMSSPRAIYADGRQVAARVLASDKRLDIALLAIPADPKSARPLLGDATALAVGDELYAIGAPRKLAFTLSRGIVSYVGRPLEGTRWLQTDMSINDGNSGGPLLNERGEIVGVIAFIYRRAQGLSFALPINYVLARFGDRIPPRDMAEAAERSAALVRFRAWEAADSHVLPAPQ